MPQTGYRVNGNADSLSRRPYISAIETPGLQTKRIKEHQRRDPDLRPIINCLETQELPANDNKARSIPLTIDDYHLSPEGVLFHLWTPRTNRRKNVRLQLVLPKSLRYEILTWAHDDVTGRHFGIKKTYQKMQEKYFWRGMFKDIEHWCMSCVDCEMRKTPKYKRKAPLLPIPVAGPFDRLSVDVLGPFPVSHSGNRYVVCFTEYLTKWPEIFAVPNAEAHVTARLLTTEILPRHGAPRVLLSDRGKNFLSKLVLETCRLMNTKKVKTTAYHPQTNALVERFNGTIAQALSMYVSSDLKDWDQHIPSLLFAYRVTPSSSTGDLPFYLLYGRECVTPPDVSLLPPVKLSSSVDEHRRRIVTQIEESQQLARENIQLTQQKMKHLYDRTAKDPDFQVGQKVCVYIPRRCKGLSPKLMHNWHGPFRIINKLSEVHFRL